MIEEIESCPLCGALPCDWVDNPHKAEHPDTAFWRAECEKLASHLSEHINFAETRLHDGRELGATIWRLALEDIIRENRSALASHAARLIDGGGHG